MNLIYLLLDGHLVVAPRVLVVVVFLAVVLDAAHVILVQLVQHISGQRNRLLFDRSSLSIHQLKNMIKYNVS